MANQEEIQEFEQWVVTRPKVVQETARKYPYYKSWRIKNGAPYAISCSGTKVEIVAYAESGMIRVAIAPENVLPSAVQHERELCEKHGTDYSKIKDNPRSMHVDGEWLEEV